MNCASTTSQLAFSVLLRIQRAASAVGPAFAEVRGNMSHCDTLNLDGRNVLFNGHSHVKMKFALGHDASQALARSRLYCLQIISCRLFSSGEAGLSLIMLALSLTDHLYSWSRSRTGLYCRLYRSATRRTIPTTAPLVGRLRRGLFPASRYHNDHRPMGAARAPGGWLALSFHHYGQMFIC